MLMNGEVLNSDRYILKNLSRLQRIVKCHLYCNVAVGAAGDSIERRFARIRVWVESWHKALVHCGDNYGSGLCRRLDRSSAQEVPFKDGRDPPEGLCLFFMEMFFMTLSMALEGEDQSEDDLVRMVSRRGIWTSMKGAVGPGRRPLAYLLYYVITISPACA